jgi:CheY-like chemotaxis protein
MAPSDKQAARYISILCTSCGFWFDGQAGGVARHCAQCGQPLAGSSAPAVAAPVEEEALHVLIAEDSTMLRRAMVKLLADMGCDVIEAADGAEAIVALEKDPDVVLTDVDMPRASGVDLVRALRVDYGRSATPVVVLSSNSDARIVSSMLGWNVMAYLLKDQIGSKGLREKLQQVLVAARLLHRTQTGQGRNVLVVEDSVTYRRVIVGVLRELECDVIEAGDGLEAMDLLRTNRPELIISDLRMPGTTGLDLLHHVRSLPGRERLPFVMLTGSGDDDTMAEAMLAGISAYILKDEVDPRTLMRKIRDALTTASALA